MNVTKISLAALLAASIVQTSFAFSRAPLASDTCPAEDTIKQIGSTYTAPGGWVGVMQKNADKIHSFEMVLYKPNLTTSPFKMGELLRCVYKLDNGKLLDLRLPTISNKAYITNSKNWFAAYGGNQYVCSKGRLICDFHLTNK